MAGEAAWYSAKAAQDAERAGAQADREDELQRIYGSSGSGGQGSRNPNKYRNR